MKHWATHLPLQAAALGPLVRQWIGR